MSTKLQRGTAAAMLLGLVGISVLIGRNAYVRARIDRQSLPRRPPSAAGGRDPGRNDVPWTGRVSKVLDGDTVEVERAGQTVRVRLYGIDCPEQGQPFADEARELAVALVEGREVTVQPVELDRLGRTVADVLTSDGDRARHLSRELLQAGLAWWYRSECPDAHDLELLETRAREERRGLWADPDSVPPWEYRRREGTGSQGS